MDAAAVLAIAEGPPPGEAPPPEPERMVLGPGSFFLDYAGRRPPGDPAHAALATLRPGDAVGLRLKSGWLTVVHPDGTIVAALSTAARAELGPRLQDVRTVRVHQVIERNREQTTPTWRERLQVDRWKMPLVEVELGP